MGLIIIERHKNVYGNTYEYVVKNSETNRISTVKSFELLQYRKEVINADYIESLDDFRAHAGFKIKTVADKVDINEKKKQDNSLDLPKMVGVQARGLKYVNICKKIRTFAAQGKLEIEETKHLSNEGRNTELFEIIKSCGYTVKQFVQTYLSYLQPYELNEFSTGGNKISSSKNLMWAVEISYKIKLIIKVSLGATSGLVISFHESNRKGIKSNNKDSIGIDENCLIICDRWTKTEENYYAKANIQRGFMLAKFEGRVDSLYSNGVAIVKYNRLKEETDKLVDKLLNNIKASYLNANFGSDFSGLGTSDFKFPSFGFQSINMLVFISDLYSKARALEVRKTLVGIATEFIDELGENEVELIRNTFENAGYFDKKDAILNKLLIENRG